MAMFADLKFDFEALADKTGIDAYQVQFFGFSGNEETMQMAYARYCRKRHGYTNLDGGNDNFNSHIPSLARYRAMLVEWKSLGVKQTYTKEEIQRVVNGKHRG